MKVTLLVIAMVALTLACARDEKDRTVSELPLTALVQLMVPSREEIKEIPDLDSYEESHGVLTEPRFEVGDFDVFTNRMREEQWSLGFARHFSNPEVQGGGSILYVTLSVDVFAGNGGASRMADVMHTALQHHLEFTAGGQGITKDFDVHGLGDDAWGVQTTVLDGGPTTVAIVGFVEGNTIGQVWVERQDDVAETGRAERLAVRLLDRIRDVKSGEFDHKPGALEPKDVLVLSKIEMAARETFHVEAARRLSLEGEDVSYTLDFDVAPIDGAIGTLRGEGFPPVDVFVQGGVAYYRERAGSWKCLAEVTSTNPIQLGLVRPELDLLFQRAGTTEEMTFVAGDNPDVYRVRSTVDAKPFAQAVPELLGAGSYLRERYPSIGQGTVVLDFVVNKADLTLAELTYEMRLTVDLDQVIVKSESTFSEYGKDVTFPEARVLPLCPKYDDPPCKGTHLTACIAAPPELSAPSVPANACDGDKPRICIVPVGSVSSSLLAGVLTRLQTLVPDAPVTVAPALPAASEALDKNREQVSDTALLSRVEKDYKPLADDPNVVLIVITPIDMFIAQEPETRFVFGLRRGTNAQSYRLGLISYWRMDEVSFGKPANPQLLEERLTKLVLKYALTMYHDLPESSDPTSVLYNRLFSLDALDKAELAVPDN